MPSNQLNVHADSDFGYSEPCQFVLDLTPFKIYHANGEAMIKIADLKTLNIPIKVMEREPLISLKAA